MILAIPVLALMALLATAILAMPLVEPRRKMAAVVTIPLGMAESLQATEGLKCCHSRHSGRTVPLSRSKARTFFLLSLRLEYYLKALVLATFLSTMPMRDSATCFEYHPIFH